MFGTVGLVSVFSKGAFRALGVGLWAESAGGDSELLSCLAPTLGSAELVDIVEEAITTAQQCARAFSVVHAPLPSFLGRRGSS